ncbi:unnamed protein product [Nippostrongylus brasiliensis]|uniref:DNA replication licensing factor MCM2 (inferred by orthology to a human protein) n=1 Tax=Nippostrongylus brasiliensis TaxID=27835 RepID=A0A0N4XII7_NIPBR|nr:unnamed protein product [Nippostrongylus brasiliensis]
MKIYNMVNGYIVERIRRQYYAARGHMLRWGIVTGTKQKRLPDNATPLTENLEASLLPRRNPSDCSGTTPEQALPCELVLRLAGTRTAFLQSGKFVNDDDVQAATRIMLESFINTQKASIMRQMRKTFSKYLTVNRSSGELLLFVLKQLVKEQMYYETAKGKGSSVASVAIAESDFIEKAYFIIMTPSVTSLKVHFQAQQLKIENVKAFYSSELFAAHHFSYDDRLKQIVQAIF